MRFFVSIKSAVESIDIILSNPLVALFLVVGTGLLLGSLEIRGMSLGSSGVLFTALICGHFGYGLPSGVGTVGLVLFVYCVGVGAGGRFFSAIAREGSTLAQLALLIVGLAAVLAWAASAFLDIPAGLAVGIFAGAMTSTPALAAGTEGLGPLSSDVIIGYGIAYPFGVIGVVLFVQLMPKLFRQDLDSLARAHAKEQSKAESVRNVLVEVTNTNLLGKRISEAGLVNFNACKVSRVLRGNRLVPLQYDDVFEEGQCLYLVGREKEIKLAVDFLGTESNKEYVSDSENERERLVVTAKGVMGSTLRQLAPLKDFGVLVTRVTRLDLTFVPTADTRVENRDLLTVVGQPEALKKFATHIGHRSQAFDETDLLSLALGLTLGIIVGMIPLGLPGGDPITLGMAGGPLLVALLLGHFGRVGRIVGFIPRPTRLLLQEFGLVLFLADAGVKGGAQFLSTLEQHGPVLFAVGCAITLVPMVLAYALAQPLFKLNPLQALGGICGGMTSTPALGAITARTDSQLPVVSYATAYPVALIIMTLFAKILIGVLTVVTTGMTP